MSDSALQIENYSKKWADRLIAANEIISILADIDPHDIRASIESGEIHSSMEPGDAIALKALLQVGSRSYHKCMKRAENE